MEDMTSSEEAWRLFLAGSLSPIKASSPSSSLIGFFFFDTRDGKGGGKNSEQMSLRSEVSFNGSMGSSFISLKRGRFLAGQSLLLPAPFQSINNPLVGFLSVVDAWKPQNSICFETVD